MSTDDRPPDAAIDETIDVAIDVGPLYGHRTGVGVAADGMLTGLGRRDDVRLHPFLVSGRSQPRAGHRKLPVPGIVASHLWARGRHPLADRWLTGADVVHGTNYVAPPTRLPTVVSVYDCWFLRHPERATPVVRRAGQWLRRTVAAGAWVHTSSEATTDQVRELLATDRVDTVVLGAPDIDHSPAPDDPGDTRLTGLGGAPFVVSIATEERRKGLPLAVEAFEQLAIAHPDLHLVVAGAPADDTDRLVAAIDACRAKGRIIRLGPIGEATKRWLLATATALVYPSLDEGFGFPVLEANAAGLPVVATAVGSIPEIAGDAAVLIDRRDASDLADALHQVIDDEHRRHELVVAGERNLGRFRWSTTAARLSDLYRRALTT